MNNLLRCLGLAAFVLVSVSAYASDQDESDITVVKACLKNFGKHPFNAEKPRFRVMAAKVRVLGIGGKTFDDQPTDKPELVLVKPNVSVLSRNDLVLNNPNGWYCLKGQVAVLGKAVIHLHCKAKLVSSRDSVTVLGGNDHDAGVTVLGTTNVDRIGCEEEGEKTASAEKTAKKVEKKEAAAEKSAEKPAETTTEKPVEKSAE